MTVCGRQFSELDTISQGEGKLRGAVLGRPKHPLYTSQKVNWACKRRSYRLQVPLGLSVPAFPASEVICIPWLKEPSIFKDSDCKLYKSASGPTASLSNIPTLSLLRAPWFCFRCTWIHISTSLLSQGFQGNAHYRWTLWVAFISPTFPSSLYTLSRCHSIFIHFF